MDNNGNIIIFNNSNNNENNKKDKISNNNHIIKNNKKDNINIPRNNNNNNTNKVEQNPYETTNWFSKLFFLWIFPFLKQANNNSTSDSELKLQDLYKIPRNDESFKLGNELESKWNQKLSLQQESGKGKLKLLNILISIYGGRFICFGALDMFNECVLRVLQPLLVRSLIQSFNQKDSEEVWRERYIYAVGLCLVTFLYSIILHTAAFQQFRLGMQIRIALSTMLFRKTLKLSQTSLESTTPGRTVNLLSTDVSRFDNAILIPYILIGPLQLCIFTYLLWTELELNTLSMVGLIGIILPFQYAVFKYSSKFRLKTSNRTDARASFMSQLLNAISIIKMYVWEKPFASIIHGLRAAEIKNLAQRATVQALYLSVFNVSAKILILSTISSLVLSGSEFGADKIFFCVSIANTMLYANLFCIPSAANQIAGIVVSMKRLQEFFLLPEHSCTTTTELHEETDHTNNSIINVQVKRQMNVKSQIEFNDVTAGWNPDKAILKRINTQLKEPKLVMVIGTIGSGKSSFLNSILGEIQPFTGRLTIHGSLSYASQEPWCFKGSVKQNILFGQPFDEVRYNEVIAACALRDDLKQWPYGDNTLVGERGVALSGGQKARLNLARCLYRQAAIYLMDDPLSAVDASVASVILKNAMKNYLKAKLRILVTHQHQFLPEADYILVLHDGELIAQGSYQEIQSQGLDLLSLMATETTTEGDANNKHLRRKSTLLPEIQALETTNEEQAEFDEAGVKGSVSFKTYLQYFKSSKSMIASTLLSIGFIAGQILMSSCEFWLSLWTNKQDKMNESPLNSTEKYYYDTYFYLYVYIGIVSSATLFCFITTLGFFKYCMRIGINLHDSMFHGIISAKMEFFHQNPSGRIMNRFTKDLASVDELLPESMYNTIQMFLQLIGIVVIVCISNYFILIPTCFVLIAFYYTRRFYIGTARNIKRLEAQSRSQLFTHLNSSMAGLATIRSSNSTPLLNTEFEGYQDFNSRPYFMFLATTRWFAIWLELTTVIYLCTITFSFFFLSSSNLTGNIGLAISSALVLNLNFQLGMRQSAETENNMISVERILEYSGIPSEEESLSRDSANSPPSSVSVLNSKAPHWPSSGGITFRNVSLSYYSGKLALNNLNCEISPGSKIGIVGRTGAGKSSIITALFRLTEPTGDIFIDGVSINQLPLSSLRSAISIIPQEPILFSGTLRYNLDPFSQYSDSELWDAIEQVQLKETIIAQGGGEGLDFIVKESGNNFSVGQRQLVCLARAILRKEQNRIIVIDEATANVDPKTDEFIQQTIRSKFSHFTIITIAHRLHTVIDSDKILVLDHGSIIEYDHPYLLLQKLNGAFSTMVNKTGSSNAVVLRELAKQAYEASSSSFCNSRESTNF